MHELNQARAAGRLADRDGRARLAAFIGQVSAPAGVAALVERYPVLGRLLGTATWLAVEALRVALAHPKPALVGVHRSNYEKVGQIELIGLVARQWRTRSGYAGLTVYFWDRSANNWATGTEARA